MLRYFGLGRLWAVDHRKLPSTSGY
jgi:hypothetical protein